MTDKTKPDDNAVEGTDQKAPDAADGTKRRKKTVDAPFGFDVVGEDGRRILRGLAENVAREEAHRIATASGEDIDVVPAEAQAPSVPGESPNPDFPPILDGLRAPEDA